MNDLRILIIAGDPLARAGLAALLVNQAGCSVAGQASDTDDLAAALAVFRPDAVVWDVGWDVTSRQESLAAFCEVSPPVLAILGSENQASDVWLTGVRSIVSRSVAGEQLVAALHAITHRLIVTEPAFLPNSSGTSRGEPAPTLVEPLTERELGVLAAMAEGLSNKLIARNLSISEHTVKFHVNAIMGKLGAQSRTDAVVRATRAGIILL
jgi:two-component system nitrate/nitrite response regulator NarL